MKTISLREAFLILRTKRQLERNYPSGPLPVPRGGSEPIKPKETK